MSREEEDEEEKERLTDAEGQENVLFGVSQVLMLLRDEATQRAASVFVYLKVAGGSQ